MNQYEDEVHWLVMENHNDQLNQRELIDHYSVMLQNNDHVRLIQHMHLVDHFLQPKFNENLIEKKKSRFF
jgi:hypothetical protein